MVNIFSFDWQKLREQAKARLSERNWHPLAEASNEQLEQYQMALEIEQEERQRAYQELNELYQHYWYLYEYAPCGYITLNKKGIITRINQQAIKLLAYPQASLTRLEFLQFIAPENQSLLVEALDTAQTKQENVSLELKLIRSDETRVWVHLEINAKVVERGERQQWWIILTDISAEKEAEKAQAKADRLQLITDSVQDGIAYLDRFQRHQFVNQRYQQWLGYSQKAIIGKTIQQVIGYSAYAVIEPAITRVLKGETVIEEMQFPYQNQQQRDVLMTLVPETGEAREVEGFYLLMSDLSERKQLERRIQQQETFLHSIYDGVEQAIFVVDVLDNKQLIWRDLNAISEQLIKLDRKQVKGQPLEAIFSNHLGPIIQQGYEAILKKKRSVSYEERIPYQGHLPYWLITLTPLLKQQGQIDRIVGMAININERKQLEMQLQQQVERERLLNDIIYQIRSSLDIEAILNRTIDKILNIFQISRVVVTLHGLDHSQLEFIDGGSFNSSQQGDPSQWVLWDASQAQTRFQQYSVIAIDNVTSELEADDPLYETACQKNVCSLLAVPIGNYQQLQGEICLQQCQTIHHWREWEKQLLIDVSHQLAIALQQARLYHQLQQELDHRIELQQQLHYHAIHDHLTGLPNREHLIERLKELLDHRHQDVNSSHWFALFFLDLNGFKYINDTFGHTVGDELLIAVSQRLQSCLRENDIIARFGGDEFVILLERLHQSQDAINIANIANRIHHSLQTPIYLHHSQQEVQVETSIGIVFDEANYTDSETILRDADIAMYISKRNWKPYVIYNELDQTP